MQTSTAARGSQTADPATIEWISIQQCAARYGVAAQTVRRWIDLELIEARRFGPKLIRVDAASVERSGEPVI